MDESKAVVLTGCEVVAASGIGAGAVWEAVRKGRSHSGIAEYRVPGGESIRFPAHTVDPLPLRDFTTADERRELAANGLLDDRDMGLLVVAARLALARSGLRYDPRDNRIGLVLAHENPGLVTMIDQLLDHLYRSGTPPAAMRLEDVMRPLSRTVYNVQTFPHLFYLARLLKLQGMALAVNNACASGLYALETAAHMVRSGQADAVVVVTGDHAHVSEYIWLQNQGFCSPTGCMRPFDRSMDGAVLGDGAAAVVVETAERAHARGAAVQAEYVGGRFAQETWRMTLPDVTARLYERVIVDLLAGYGGPVDLVVPHGTGSPLLDRYESDAICRAFAPGPVPPVTALKPYIGHTLGASALLEAVLATEAMRAGLIPPVLGCTEVHPLVRAPIVTEPIHRPVRSVLKTVSAFGGFTAAVLLRRPEGG